VDVDPVRFRQNVHVVTTHFAVKRFFARSKATECAHLKEGRGGGSRELPAIVGMELKGDWGQSPLPRGTTATKSRTVFCSGIENAALSRANQNALDEPPSKLSARKILKRSTIWVVPRIFANSVSVISEQIPSATRSEPPIAAKVLRADRVSSRPRTGRPRSTRNGP